MSTLAPWPRGAPDSSARARSARRQRLVAHLHASGPRPVLEALLELEAGRALLDLLAVRKDAAP
jgi:hypothetical protein